MIYGRETLSPRLQAWHGDEGISYRYSGKTFTTLPWTPSLVGLCHSINQAFGLKLNSVLANLYRDGQDSMGWHADDEMELGSDPIIVSVSVLVMNVRDMAAKSSLFCCQKPRAKKPAGWRKRFAAVWKPWG